MTAIAERETIDFDQREAEVDSRIKVLEEARQRLAYEKVLGSDPDVVQEHATVQSQLSAAYGEKADIGLARVEHARREMAAEKEARAAGQQAAVDHARRLQVDRERAVRGIDSACVKLACALADYRRVCAGQGLALTRAGWREDVRSGVRLIPLLIEGGLKHALREQRVEDVFDMHPLPPRHVKPLKDSDPRILEPLLTDADEEELMHAHELEVAPKTRGKDGKVRDEGSK